MTMQSALSGVMAAVGELQKRYKESPLRLAVSQEDDMLAAWDRSKAHYQSVGENALEIVFQSMMLCGATNFRSILDMPSGFGRVTRHLRSAFPDAAVHACDLYQKRIDFCAREIGAIPIKSRENFDEIVFASKFDLIWCGSLLTHLTAPQFKSALRLFSRSLTQDGVAVVTLHGRHSLFIQHNKWKYLPDDAFAPIEVQYGASGFVYGDYNRPDVFFEQQSYGISLSAPSYVLKCLEQDESIRIKAYCERQWDDHQDVVIFQKKPINA